jgi:hypothetical protein
MADEMKYDFVKAQSLLKTSKFCRRSLDDLANRLLREAENAGVWWKGESHGGLKEAAARNRFAISEIAGEIALITDYIMKVSEDKKNWERNGAKHFK